MACFQFLINVNLPLDFLSIFVEDPFSSIAVPRDGNVIPFAVISGRSNEQFFIINVQCERAIILYYKGIILKFTSHYVRVGQRCSRVLCVIRA